MSKVNLPQVSWPYSHPTAELVKFPGSMLTITRGSRQDSCEVFILLGALNDSGSFQNYSGSFLNDSGSFPNNSDTFLNSKEVFRDISKVLYESADSIKSHRRTNYPKSLNNLLL